MSLINEANAIMGHDAAADIVAHHCRLAGGLVWREFVLPDGKRADVYWVSSDGAYNVFEVKSHYSETSMRSAAAKYGRWCNALWLAVPELEARHLPSPRFADTQWQTWAAPGIVGVRSHQLDLLRIARHHQMHGENAYKIRLALQAMPSLGEQQSE